MALFHELIANLPAVPRKNEYQFIETDEIVRILEEYGYRTRAADPNPRRIGDEVRLRRRTGDGHDIREREARVAVVDPTSDQYFVWVDGDYESVGADSVAEVVSMVIDILGVPDNRAHREDDDEYYGL